MANVDRRTFRLFPLIVAIAGAILVLAGFYPFGVPSDPWFYIFVLYRLSPYALYLLLSRFVRFRMGSYIGGPILLIADSWVAWLLLANKIEAYQLFLWPVQLYLLLALGFLAGVIVDLLRKAWR